MSTLLELIDRISLKQLALALERYGNKYDAFEVFADDVEELHSLRRGERLPAVLEARAQGRDLLFKVNHAPYRLTLSEKSAIAKITRGTSAPDNASDFKVLGGLLGSAIGLATSSKGEGWMPGLFVGILAGHLVDQQHRERTVTVRYDSHAGQWRAYGGPMSQWLRQQAAANP